ncbi:MAG: hypothetical protein ACRDVG_05070 [Jatrophihabitantaceae bacterium]
MDERPFPHGPLPQPRPSRRGFLVAGAVTLAAAGGGVALGTATGPDDHVALDPAASRELGAAADAERARIAQVDAALRGARAGGRAALRAIRADHAAHLAAITASIADAVYPATMSPSPSRSANSSPPAAGHVSVADVHAGERAAAQAAGGRAAFWTSELRPTG